MTLLTSWNPQITSALYFTDCLMFLSAFSHVISFFKTQYSSVCMLVHFLKKLTVFKRSQPGFASPCQPDFYLGRSKIHSHIISHVLAFQNSITAILKNIWKKIWCKSIGVPKNPCFGKIWPISSTEGLWPFWESGPLK